MECVNKGSSVMPAPAERPVGVDSLDNYIAWLRKQWRGATPDQRTDIERDVTNLKAAQTRAAAWEQQRAAAEKTRLAALAAGQARRAAEWPIDRIRSLMQEVRDG
jgi:hypothetical protein